MAHDIEQIYHAHAQAIFAFLLNLSRSEAEAGDLLQEIFLKLAAKPRLLSGVERPRAYLFRMAQNSFLNARRSSKVHLEALRSYAAERSELFLADPAPDDPAFGPALSIALAELPPDQLAVVHLKIWEGMTFLEVAVALEINEHTAASRYRYALAKLADLLRPLHDERP